MKKIFALLITALVGACTAIPVKESFMVDIQATRYAAGSTEVYFKKASLSATLNKSDVEVYYYPSDDAVCLQFRTQQFSNCRQFWDKEGRDAFISAFERYKQEYEQRQLTVKNNFKTREKYGHASCFFVWQRTRFSVQGQVSPRVNLGYQFNGGGAFFTTTQLEAPYEDSLSDSTTQNSPVMIMYFTRSQAENLITVFNQEYLRGLGRPVENDIEI